MDVIKFGLMELAHDADSNMLSAQWSDDLSVESAQFLQSIVYLFKVVQERNVANLVVDSGVPAGGVLTEEVLHYFVKHISNTPLQKIAILESPDYLWDNNLYQVIQLLISNYQLPIKVKLLKSQADCLEWFSQSWEMLSANTNPL
ncbi:hypothetical protein [Pontibacter harenae]|uniref:hypothetical protein n=1 Tax=Pontibacter harenae TaxID=2894083 RepID=UPI001E58BB3B|nr:hypothetical protein [Pontibacter harenae]MCC9166409.1 hypothetical protein [Pontibacter harenae]